MIWLLTVAVVTLINLTAVVSWHDSGVELCLELEKCERVGGYFSFDYANWRNVKSNEYFYMQKEGGWFWPVSYRIVVSTGFTDNKWHYKKVLFGSSGTSSMTEEHNKFAEDFFHTLEQEIVIRKQQNKLDTVKDNPTVLLTAAADLMKADANERERSHYARQLHDVYIVSEHEYERNYTVDIVLIHGLGGHYEKSWLNDRERHWTTHELAAVIEQELHHLKVDSSVRPRVLSLHYNALPFCFELMGRCSHATFYQIGKMILENLWYAYRTLGFNASAPIIFMSHSMGGLVLKAGLVEARLSPSTHTQFSSFLQRIAGVVFFGTPHRGSKLATDILNTVGPYAQAAEKLKVFLLDLAPRELRMVTGKTILSYIEQNMNYSNLLYILQPSDSLQVLKRNDSRLLELHESFSDLGYNCFSVRETIPIVSYVGLVVDLDSANHNRHITNETSVSIQNADHFEICKPNQASKILRDVGVFAAQAIARHVRDARQRRTEDKEEQTDTLTEIFAARRDVEMLVHGAEMSNLTILQSVIDSNLHIAEHSERIPSETLFERFVYDTLAKLEQFNHFYHLNLPVRWDAVHAFVLSGRLGVSYWLLSWRATSELSAENSNFLDHLTVHMLLADGHLPSLRLVWSMSASDARFLLHILRVLQPTIGGVHVKSPTWIDAANDDNVVTDSLFADFLRMLRFNQFSPMSYLQIQHKLLLDLLDKVLNEQIGGFNEEMWRKIVLLLDRYYWIQVRSKLRAILESSPARDRSRSEFDFQIDYRPSLPIGLPRGIGH